MVETETASGPLPETASVTVVDTDGAINNELVTLPETSDEPLPKTSNGPLTETSLVTLIDRDELATKLDELVTRARAAGISPLQALMKSYAKRGMAVIEGLLSALEEAPNKTPADTEKKV
mgnify:CR=1 FL=1